MRRTGSNREVVPKWRDEVVCLPVALTGVRPFVLNVADLVHRPAARRHEELSGPLEEDLVVTETIVKKGTHLVIDVVLEAVSDGVLVAGTASSTWTALCRRCVNPARATITVAFREMYALHPDPEGDTYPILHDCVDLELVAREAILLDLPLAPLCTEECRGLCPTCGADLNDGPCPCEEAPRDHRWAALETLKPTAPENPEH